MVMAVSRQVVGQSPLTSIMVVPPYSAVMASRPHMRPWATITLAAVVTLVGGCTGSSSSSSSTDSGPVTAVAAPSESASAGLPSPSDPATSVAVATSSTPTSSAMSSPASSAHASAVVAPTMILEPDGLGFLVSDASIRHLRFGEADATAVSSALTAALGGALTVNDLPECGQGPRKSLQRAGFSALLDGTTFVGWTDQGAAGRRLTTANGIGIGSTLGSVKASMTGVTTANDTLGPEFISTSSFGGMLTGLTSSSTVKLTYAGETCFFR
jgi:hypothetical protein